MTTEIRSGLVELDRNIGSLVPGDLMLVGGRPNSGKSVFAVNIAMQCNYTHASTVVLYSNSESTERVLQRLSDYDGIPHGETHKWRDIVSDASAPHFLRIKAPKRKGSLLICDNSTVSVANIKDDLRCLEKEDNPPLLVIIDYLHLLTFAEKTHYESHQLRLSASVIALKNLALSANVSIVLITSVNRYPLEQRRDKRPQLTDLPITKEAIDHTDTIILLYREALYSQSEKQTTESLELNVVNNKQNDSSTVRVRFAVHNLRFENPPLSIV